MFVKIDVWKISLNIREVDRYRLCNSTSITVGRKMCEAIFKVENLIRCIERLMNLKQEKWNHENLFLISGVAIDSGSVFHLIGQPIQAFI